MQSDKTFQALSLCRRAGKLVMGFDAVAESVLKGKAFLVLTAVDLSPKTQKRISGLCEGLTELYGLPLTQLELCQITRKPVGVYSVTDENLAVLCKNSLTQTKEDTRV